MKELFPRETEYSQIHFKYVKWKKYSSPMSNISHVLLYNYT